MAPFQSLVPNFVFMVPSNCVSFGPIQLGATPIFVPALPPSPGGLVPEADLARQEFVPSPSAGLSPASQSPSP